MKKHDIENEPKTLNEINEANAFIILKCSFAEFEFVICSRQFAAIHGLYLGDFVVKLLKLKMCLFISQQNFLKTFRFCGCSIEIQTR